METPKASVMLKDFPGFMSNMDPRDIPEGAAEVQVNATCVVQGELQVRLGYLPVKFEN